MIKHSRVKRGLAISAPFETTTILAFMEAVFDFFLPSMKSSQSKRSNGSSHRVNSRAHVQQQPTSITHNDEPRRMSWEIEVGQKEVERLQAKIKSLSDKLGRMEREHADVIKQLNRANHQVETLQNQSQSQSLAMDEMNEKFANTRELLTVRTNELSGVQKFLTREDEFSGKDAMEKVCGGAGDGRASEHVRGSECAIGKRGGQVIDVDAARR
jgi:seryl-tRNA synthetase